MSGCILFLLGDVTAIYRGTTKVAEYVYDAWGNCTITLNNSGYGSRNPIRYRGYYWDEDLGMYYLMTRYYDPKMGRFINADSFEYLESKTINGLNLYAYCGNNPVMYCDPTGHFLLELGVVLFGVIGVLGVSLMIGAAGVIIGVVAPGIGDVLKEAAGGIALCLIEMLVGTIECILRAFLGIPSKEDVDSVSGELVGIDVYYPNNPFDYNKIDNPNEYVDWGQRSPGYFGIGGTIAGDPLLYTFSEDTTVLP